MHCYRMAFFALGLGETVFLAYVWIEVTGDKIPPSTFFYLISPFPSPTQPLILHLESRFLFSK